MTVSQDGNEFMTISYYNTYDCIIFSDAVITVVMVRPVQTVPERNGEVRVCARKDIVTAGPVSANIATFSNKAIGRF